MSSVKKNEYDANGRCMWLDILKGIGIISVVIGHIYSNRIVYNWFYSFHMPLFFLAAGWCYREKPIFVDIKHRIQTIVVPYFSFGLLILIYWQLVERRFRDSDIGFIDSLLGLFSGEYQYLSFNVHLWFLPCFFLTVVIFNICVNIRYIVSKQKNTAQKNMVGGRVFAYLISGLMSIAYVIICMTDYPLPNLFWGFDRTLKYIGFYAVGGILRDHNVDEILRKSKKNLAIFGAVIMLTMNFVLAYIGRTTGLMWFVTALIGCTFVIIVSVIIEQNRILQYLGRISLVILCVHGPLYRVIIKLVSIPLRMSTDAVRESFIWTILIAILTLGGCGIVYELIVRVFPWMVGKQRVKDKSV